MDSVVLDGVEYVKASIVAKRFKYTSDYVGQLCRAKKVDARLVGRTWFVNPDSITEHKKNKHTKALDISTSKEEENKSTTIKTKPVRTKINSVIKSKTFKAIMASAGTVPSSLERKLRVSYERDEESLIPTINRIKTRPPVMVRIEPANAKKLNVKGHKKNLSDFVAEEIPDFALSGKVSVKSLHEAEVLEPQNREENTAIKPLNIVKTVKLDVATDVKDKKVNTDTIQKEKAESSTKVKSKVLRPTTMSRITLVHSDISATKDNVFPENKAASKNTEPTSVKSVKPIDASFTPKLVESTKVYKVSIFTLYSSLFFTLIAILITLIIFSTSSVIFATSDSYESSLVLNFENLKNIFEYYSSY